MSMRPRGVAGWLALAMLVVLACLLGAAVLAPWLAPYDPDRTMLLARLRPPLGLGGSFAHPLGTDQLGRDMLSRSLFGLRNSLGIGLAGSLIGLSLGAAIGLLAGMRPGRLDQALMLLVDVQLALPYLLVVLVGLAVFGSSISVLIPLISLAGWEHTARLVRGQMLMLRGLAFVEAAVATGAHPARVLLGHVLPHLLPLLALQFTLGIPHVIILESSLSFLGIGVQPPTATLGRMIGEGRPQMLAAWWTVAEPTLLILASALALQLLSARLLQAAPQAARTGRPRPFARRQLPG